MRKFQIALGFFFCAMLTASAQQNPLSQALTQYEKSPRLAASTEKTLTQQQQENFRTEIRILRESLNLKQEGQIIAAESKVKNSMRELMADEQSAAKLKSMQDIFQHFDGYTFLKAEEKSVKEQLERLEAFARIIY